MRIRDDDVLGEPEFSMAPLIDVVFQLLLFFMLATSFGQRDARLDLDLPSARSGASAAAPRELVVDVERDGRVWVAGRLVAAESDLDGARLVDELTRAAEGRADVPVNVRGDRLAHHEAVVRVLDACALAGLSNLSVSTVPADGGR